MRNLVNTYGVSGTYTFSKEYLNYEQFNALARDTLKSTIFSLIGVLLVILFITGSVTVTLMVGACVLLVDVYLLAVVYYSGLTFNIFTVMMIVVGLGLAVDYSCHIAHCFLVALPPKPKGRELTDGEKRKFKIEMALR